jgi:UPF0755 protein
MENSFLGEKQPEPELPKLNKKTYLYTFSIFGFLLIFYYLFFSAPLNFPPSAVVNIEPGMGLRSVSLVLKKEHIIRSRVAFESFAIILGGDKKVQSASYLFENKLPVYSVAWRILNGEHGMPPVSVTIPEGFDIKQIADTFDVKLSNFDKTNFELIAKEKEGYLFPDTYFFLIADDEKKVLQSMSQNFNKKIAPLLTEIKSSGKTEKEIIIMASIIEREAKGDGDRGVISGILWRRISINMPLQVDAAMETYKKRGLPEGPIGNPGLEAIKAAIYPQSSPYLYYLHDKDGNIHYAKTFAEHKTNIARYLQ